MLDFKPRGHTHHMNDSMGKYGAGRNSLICITNHRHRRCRPNRHDLRVHLIDGNQTVRQNARPFKSLSQHARASLRSLYAFSPKFNQLWFLTSKTKFR